MKKRQYRNFIKRLMRWYEAHGRHSLPWRHTKDPYHILVSEIMLQQTQVDRVIPKYKAFLKRFPTLQKLARASTASVLREWRGMGYNRRALYLKRIAEMCMREFNGKVPDVYEALRRLPGIGEYTARAVLAFVFNKPVAFHDTNIRRIFARMFFGKNPSAVSENRLANVIHHSSPSPLRLRKGRGSITSAAYHAALMDFGSLVCRAKPLCSVCPMRTMCKVGKRALYGERSRTIEGHVVRNPQSKFEGSDREIRGRIVEMLRQRKAVAVKNVIDVIPAEAGIQGPGSQVKPGMTKKRFQKILCSLVRDGLITKKGSMVMLPK